MTAELFKETFKAIRDLENRVGPKAEVILRIDGDGVSGSIYTKGIAQNERGDVEAFTVYARGYLSFEEALSDLEKQWASESEARSFRIIEKIAFEIIRATAEFGSCTDAALRAEFGNSVARFGEAAIVKANQMAANGPFSIVAVAGANMMAAE